MPSSQRTRGILSWSRQLLVRRKATHVTHCGMAILKFTMPAHVQRQSATCSCFLLCAGRNFLVKVNANIGNSAVSSSIEEVQF